MEMLDANGNHSDESFVTPNDNNLYSISRYVKRSKSCNLGLRIPNIDRSPAPKPEEISGSELILPVYLRYSSQFIVFSPCGSFGKLPNELIYLLLTYLPLNTIGRLGQTSKAIRDILIRWTATQRMYGRLVRCASFPFVPKIGICGKTLLPQDLHRECQLTGVLIKQLTYLFPSSQRLGLYYQLTNEVKVAILQRNPNFERNAIEAMNGVILHSMISGWDRTECTQVFTSLSQWNGIGALTKLYINNPVPTDESIEKLLRLFLRSLFLDYCSPADRSQWVGIVFDAPELSTLTDVAKLLLLLYAPQYVTGGGEILWDFSEEDGDFCSWENEYKTMAETVAYLIEPNRRCCSPEEVIDLIETVTRLPTEWGDRAKGSFLLCLHCVDSKSVMTFFKCLTMKDDMPTLIKLLTNAVFMASDLIASEDVGKVHVTIPLLVSFIRNAINSGWNNEDRKTIIKEIWCDIRELTSNLFDESILMGNTSDLHNLMETWKEICFQLTF